MNTHSHFLGKKSMIQVRDIPSGWASRFLSLKGATSAGFTHRKSYSSTYRSIVLSTRALLFFPKQGAISLRDSPLYSSRSVYRMYAHPKDWIASLPGDEYTTLFAGIQLYLLVYDFIFSVQEYTYLIWSLIRISNSPSSTCRRRWWSASAPR